MADHTGWRNFWWLNVAMLGATLIMVFFGFPETRWHRIHPDEMKIATGSSGPSSKEKVIVDLAIASDLEKSSPSRETADLSHAATAQRDPFLGRGTPSKQQFRLFQPNAHPIKSIAIDLWTPWKLFAFPIVEFASFVVSWSASSFLTLNLTQSQAFAAPPYNFSSEKIGFFNFAILVGAMIGLLTAGPLSDWVSMRATRKNKGIREPEMRLPSMIPYVLIMMLGNFIVAFGYQHAWDWKVSHSNHLSLSPPLSLSLSPKADGTSLQVIVIIGFTCGGIQVAALPSIASTYAVDSYKPVSGSIFVSITVNKNVWGYGFAKFITPWIISSGYVPPIMTNMSLVTLWCLFGILFWWMGKTFRLWSKDSKVHRM